MMEWFETRPFVKNLAWYKKYYGNRKLKGLLKKQDFWLKNQNFGDYLSRIIVASVARQSGLTKRKKSDIGRKMLAIGSILHFANDDDVIWGSGVNGKVNPQKHKFSRLDVRMVRGPLTKKFLTDRNIAVPGVFGEPALLLRSLYPNFTYRPIRNKIVVLPNLNEISICQKKIPKTMHFVSPLRHWKVVLNEILTSELVITSSLHGIVLSEVFEVPVRFIMPVGGETIFKYKDYYQGTGRDITNEPSSIANGLTINSGVTMPAPKFDKNAMINAFPRDLYE